MKLNSLLSLFLLIFGPLSVLAQDKATLYGKILNEKDKPIAEATIKVVGLRISTVTKADGSYSLELPSGEEVEMEISHLSYQPIRFKVELEAGEQRALDLSLKDDLFMIGAVNIDVRGNEKRKGIQLIKPGQHKVTVSASGDFNQVIVMQAGVSTNTGLSSVYSVRGGSYDENLVYVNGIEVYRPFLVRAGEQEGLSFINGDLVGNIRFSAGGFEAKYGDKMSSVLDIEYKQPDTTEASISASLLGATGHFASRSKNEKWTYQIGIRQKSNAYLLNSLDTKGEYRPSFTDAQSFVTYQVNPRWNLSFLGNASRNMFYSVPVSREAQIGTIQQVYRLWVQFDGQEKDLFQTAFGALSGNYHRSFDEDDLEYLDMRFTGSIFQTVEEENFDILGRYSLDVVESNLGKDNFGEVIQNLGVGSYLHHARNSLVANIRNLSTKGELRKGQNTLMWGARAQREAISDTLKEWQYIDSAGYSLPRGSTIEIPSLVESRINLLSGRYSGYVQNDHVFTLADQSSLLASAGVRATYWDYTKELNISPRVNLSYIPNWDSTDVSFRLAWGIYNQPPFYRELRNIQGVLNPEVRAQRAIHYVVGADWNFTAWGRPFKFFGELYYKDLSSLIPYELDNVRIRYYAENNAKGFAKGIDLKVNGEFVKGLESWVSLSVGRTKEDILDDFYYRYYAANDSLVSPISDEIVDSVKVTPGFIPRPTDQLVSVNIFFQDEMPTFPALKVHLNLQVGTGYTYGPPTFNRFQDTLRMRPYRRLDIGFSYEIAKDGKLNLLNNTSRPLKEGSVLGIFDYLHLRLEVFNLLQIKNTISYQWVGTTNLVDNNFQDANVNIAVPKFLTNRLVNLRLIGNFRAGRKSRVKSNE